MQEYRALHPIRPQTPPPATRSSPALSSSPAFVTPPAKVTNWTRFDTPLTMRSRKTGVDYVRKRQYESVENQIPLTPSVLRVADKVEKAAQTSMPRGALSTHRLHDMSEAENVKKKRKQQNGKVVQKYGEIYKDQAVDDIEKEEEVVNMRNKRLKKQWEKKYQKVIQEINRSVSLVIWLCFQRQM